MNYTITIAFFRSLQSNDNNKLINKAYWVASMNEIALHAQGDTPQEALENLIAKYEDLETPPSTPPLHNSSISYTDPVLNTDDESGQ